MSTNPLLANIKLPGRTFTLPSRGALYHNGEIEGNSEGEVHVYAMSALDEITLKNSDLLFNGQALDQVMRTCAPNIKSPQDLTGRDIDALMIFLRLVTYGPDFSIKVKHDCEDAKEHDYVVNVEDLVMQMVYLDPTEAAEKYSTVLDTGQVVKVRPVRYRDLITLFQDNLKRKQADAPLLTVEETRETLVKSLVMVIQSVDDIEDPTLIAEWVRVLTTRQQNQIADVIEKTNQWGPGSSSKVHCLDCGKEFEVELPLNPVSFFTE